MDYEAFIDKNVEVELSDGFKSQGALIDALIGEDSDSYTGGILLLDDGMGIVALAVNKVKAIREV